MEHYDLHNPILNTFKLDSTARKEHPDHYVYDAYFDENDTLRYAFFNSASYGYLLEFQYNEDGKISESIVYPILIPSIHKGAKINYLNYFYRDGELAVVKDTMNDELIFIEGMTAKIYEGILKTGRLKDFNITTVRKTDYYVEQLR